MININVISKCFNAKEIKQIQATVNELCKNDDNPIAIAKEIEKKYNCTVGIKVFHVDGDVVLRCYNKIS